MVGRILQQLSGPGHLRFQTRSPGNYIRKTHMLHLGSIRVYFVNIERMF